MFLIEIWVSTKKGIKGCLFYLFCLFSRLRQISGIVSKIKHFHVFLMDPQWPQVQPSVLALTQPRPIDQCCQCCQHPQTRLKPHRQDSIMGAGKNQLH